MVKTSRAVLMYGLTVLFAALPAGLDAGQTADAKTAAALAAATKYIENYRREFSAIVCEERQIQKLISRDGRVSKTRILVSDLMFVKVGDRWMQAPFHDVISVDGKPVRNRDDRLRKLFVEKPSTEAVEQARAIAKESGRYNLGINRTGVSPLLPVSLLDSHLAGNFTFALTDRTLAFDEIKTPTYLAFTRAGKRGDLFARGDFVVDPETGAVRSAELTASAPDAPVWTTFNVRYEEHPAMKMLVPIAMTEKYWMPAKPKDDHFEGTFTYSAFRRFQVTTSEIIK